MKIDEYHYNVMNIYAPNTDDSQFFQEVLQVMVDEDCDNVFSILGSDFNVIHNPDLDRNTGVVYHKKMQRSN